MNSFEAREVGIANDDVGGLQAGIILLAMDDEFTADHADIGIGLLAVGDVAIGEIGRVGWRMKRVSGGMNANEAHAMLNGIEKGLLALRRHGWILVRAFLGEIAGREENDGGVIMELLRVKDAAVFRGGEIKMVLGREGADGRFGDAGFAVRDFDDGVF